MKIKKNVFFVIALWKLEHRKLDISNTIPARSYKLGQLIEDNKLVVWLFFPVIALCIFSSYCPLQIWTSKTFNKDISKTITASSLRFGQLKEDGE